MEHPFVALAPTIAAQINKAQILPIKEARVEAIAKSLLSFKEKYLAVTAATGVPAIVVAAIHERESDADFSTYLGNGDPLSRASVHVPRGRGPFANWSLGAIDALTLDRLNQINDWSWERAVYEWILYNGFGPLAHGRQSGYAWAATNIYDGGKYVRDGAWDPHAWDSQLGCYAVAWQMTQLDASLKLARMADVTPAPDVAPPLGGLGGDAVTTAQLQNMLNALKLAHPPLIEDGSYGRQTKAAVEAFQNRANLTIDGVAGPETMAALEALFPKQSSAPAASAPEEAKLPSIQGLSLTT